MIDWHSVSDADVLRVRCSLPAFWCSGREWYRWFFGWVLERELTLADTDSILGRINGFGPRRYEETWEAMTRSATNFNFWRSQM